MRRSFALSLLATAVVLGGSPSRRALAGDADRTKTVLDKNFKLTIPEAWTWDELNDDDKGAGFVLIARRSVKPGVVEASARVRVVDAGGTPLETLLAQLKDLKTKDLKEVAAETNGLDWGGVTGQRLSISGKYENGASLAFEVYGAIVQGKFHQLDVRCTNGAEEQIREELNELVNGYRVLSGATKPNLPPGHPPVGGMDGGDAGGGGGEGAEGDGRTKKFGNLGLSWTLPTPSTLPAAKEGEEPTEVRWAWAGDGNPDMKPGEHGLLAVSALPGSPNPVVVELYYEDAKEGTTPQGVVSFERNFEEVMKQFSDLPAPKIDVDAELGNLKGASRTLSGKDKQDPPKPLYIRFVFAALRTGLYHVVVTGHDKGEQTYRASLKEVLAGLQWGDTKEGVRGPWVVPFPTANADRQDTYDAGKEARFTSSAMSLVKPASFARLKYDPSQNEGLKNWVFAAEARKENAYCFVGVWRAPYAAFQQQKHEPESVIDDHDHEWTNNMGDPVTVPKGAKANKKPTTYGGGKGHEYEFTGTQGGQPFVEHGWVVRVGQNVFWILLQYGGKDGEAALGKEAQTLLRSMKLEK